MEYERERETESGEEKNAWNQYEFSQTVKDIGELGKGRMSQLI